MGLVSALALPHAGAHHQPTAGASEAHIDSSSLFEGRLWGSGLGLAALVVIVAALIVAGLWLRGPTSMRSKTVLRVALVGLAAGSVLAACASATDLITAADDDGPSVLFTSTGGDALAETVRTESTVAGNGVGLPDLVGFTGRNFSTDIVDFGGITMLAYSFDGIVGNAGPGPLDVYGNPQLTDASDPDSHNVWQRMWDGSTWTNLSKPPIRFEAADAHNHFHLMELAEYSLYDRTLQVQIAPSQKVGFCFLDSQPLGFWSAGKDYEGAAQINDGSPNPYAPTNRADSFCRAGSPHAEALHMGISPGWGDLYAQNLTLQWVDISDVPPGIYNLATEMDPNNVISESNEDNNGPVFSEKTMAVWGYRASPSTVRTSGPIDVVLEAASTGPNLPPPAFTITNGPKNGTVNAEPGVQLDGSTVSYVPNPGFVGVDTIEFTARNPQSDYPYTPTKSVAVIIVGDVGAAGPFAISGSRDQIYRSGGVELSIVSDDTLDPATVTWAVNGITGGDATVGTISTTGHYQAPNAVGQVVVSATAPDGMAANTMITIALAPNHAPFIDEPLTYQGDGERIAPNDIRNDGRRITDLKVGEPVAILIPVVDLNGDPLQVTATGLPPGLVLSISTGALTGTPTVEGTYQVSAAATDGTQTTTRAFELVVKG